MFAASGATGYQMMGVKLRPTPHTLSDHLHHPESDMYSARGISTVNWARCFLKYTLPMSPTKERNLLATMAD